MTAHSLDRNRIDTVKDAAAARRRFDRAVREAAERIAEEYGKGRAASACMADIMAALGRKPPKDPVLDAPVTAEMLHDLRILLSSKHLGCTQGGGRYSSPFGSISEVRASQLTAAKLARVDYSGRYPRLRITAAGTHVLRERH